MLSCVRSSALRASWRVSVEPPLVETLIFYGNHRLLECIRYAVCRNVRAILFDKEPVELHSVPVNNHRALRSKQASGVTDVRQREPEEHDVEKHNDEKDPSPLEEKDFPSMRLAGPLVHQSNTKSANGARKGGQPGKSGMLRSG